MNVAEPGRLAYGLLGSSEADFGSAVPASTKWMVNCLTFANSDSVARTISFKIVPSGDTSGDQHYILAAVAIPANGTHVLDGLWMLHAGDKFRGFASVASKIAVRADGAVVTPVA